MTTILSHFSTVLSLCAITMVVLPPIKESIAFCTTACDSSSSELVASSSSNIFGFLIIALAIAILCFCPPDSLFPFIPQTLKNPGGN
mmetsp:Transcript_3629/g.2688  ORF Transcript_3629/g.2688 Transcript_3629/m.2688 type:complete len:87 (-) Transcript_3629:669-929(-)